MKPSQGLLIVAVGFVIALLSMAPIGFALFGSESPPALADPWGTGTMTLAFGIVCTLFGAVVMAIGVIVTGLGVFTK